MSLKLDCINEMCNSGDFVASAQLFYERRLKKNFTWQLLWLYAFVSIYDEKNNGRLEDNLLYTIKREYLNWQNDEWEIEGLVKNKYSHEQDLRWDDLDFYIDSIVQYTKMDDVDRTPDPKRFDIVEDFFEE